MDPLTVILLILSGIAFGILATMIGIGGGLLNVPFLDLIIGLETNEATYISSFVIVFTSISGFLKQKTERRIDFATVKIYLALAIPGVLIGGYMAEFIPRQLLRAIFGVVIGFASIRGIRKALKSNGNTEHSTDNIDFNDNGYRKIVDKDGDTFEYNAKINTGKIYAFLGGVLAGTAGVGGGIIFVPLLSSITGLPIHIATATSTTMIVVVSLLAVITRTLTQISEGTFNPSLLLNYGIPLAIGTVTGARIGAAKVKRIKSKNLLILFWSIAFLAGVRYIVTSIVDLL